MAVIPAFLLTLLPGVSILPAQRSIAGLQKDLPRLSRGRRHASRPLLEHFGRTPWASFGCVRISSSKDDYKQQSVVGKVPKHCQNTQQPDNVTIAVPRMGANGILVSSKHASRLLWGSSQV